MEEQPIVVKKKSRWAIRLLKISGIIFLLFIIAGIAISLIFGNDIKQLAIREINKHLSVEVKVNGDIDFSVLRNFPYASVSFSKVEIRESYKGSKSNLLESEKISLLFNILDIWRGNYNIQKVIVAKGKLNVQINEKGEGNYFIFQTTTDTSASGFNLNIDKVEFTGLETKFLDDADQQLYEFNIHNGNLSGTFGTDTLNLKLKTEMNCRHLYVSSDDYLQNKEVTISTALLIDLKNDKYFFSEMDAAVENFSFTAEGSVSQKKYSTGLNIHFTGNKIGIESFAGILPEKNSRYLRDYSSEGNLVFKGSIVGDYSAKKNPDIRFNFSVQNATVHHTELSENFKEVNFNAVFDNGINHKYSSSRITLHNASAEFNSRKIDFSLELTNFIQPFLNCQINTTVDLAEIYPLLKVDELKNASGELQLIKCFYSGPVSQLSFSPDFSAVKSGGEIKLNNGSFDYSGTIIKNVNTELKLLNGDLAIENLSAQSGSSDISVSGNCKNLISNLLNQRNGKSFSKTMVDLKIKSAVLDVNDFTANETSNQSGEGGASATGALLDAVTGNVQFTVGKFHNDKFNGTAFSGNLVCTGSELYFNNISISAEKGTSLINAKMNFADWNHVTLDATFNCKNIDITSLFYEFNNWNQTEITDKNLKGILNTTLILKAGWKKNEFDYNQLVVVADVDVASGELNNFEPMKSLSTFVKISELENIRFSHLKNQIEIRNSTVSIPAMNIFTNALNLELSGTHTFENIISYRIKLNLMQLLSNKFRAKNNFDPEAVEESTDGLFNLFLTMTGPASDPVIKYDKKTVKEKLKNDVQVEKQNLKTILQQEFDKQQVQQEKIVDWKAPEEYEEMKFENQDTLEEIIPEITDTLDGENETSVTRQKQKQAFDEFKKSLQKKSGIPK